MKFIKYLKTERQMEKLSCEEGRENGKKQREWEHRSVRACYLLCEDVGRRGDSQSTSESGLF